MPRVVGIGHQDFETVRTEAEFLKGFPYGGKKSIVSSGDISCSFLKFCRHKRGFFYTGKEKNMPYYQRALS